MKSDELHFIVTGVGGWLGHVTLESLASAEGPADAARITAIGRHEGLLELVGGRKIAVHSWEYLAQATFDSAVVVFHHAFVTKGKVTDQSEDAYRQANLEIQQSMVRFLSRSNVAGLMAPSSGAVYAYLNKTAAKNDPLVIYGRCKYEDETVFSEIAVRQGFPLVMPRIFNLSGGYINNHQGYAISSMILNCLNQQNVRVRADHPVWRSYYPADSLVRMVIKLLSEAPSGIPMIFDTAGMEVVEVGELAQRCVRLLAPGGVTVERPFIKPSPSDYYVGDPTVIRSIENRLGLRPASLDEQILATARYLKLHRPD